MNAACPLDLASSPTRSRVNANATVPSAATTSRSSIAAYEAVRAIGRRFIVATDHETRDELMICAGRGYSVIEKVGDPGLLAQALDPR